MKLIVISPPVNIRGEYDTVNMLFNHGMEIFHLRKPYYSAEELERYINNIRTEYHSKIVIHSCYELCNKYRLKGIHFTGKTAHKVKDLNDSEYTSSGAKFHKSISCHSISEVAALNTQFDYVFLSPVFDSISKHGYCSNLDICDIDSLSHKSSQNITALGGISPHNISKLRNTGIYGVAVLGYIWEEPSMDQRLDCFLRLMRAVTPTATQHPPEILKE